MLSSKQLDQLVDRFESGIDGKYLAYLRGNEPARTSTREFLDHVLMMGIQTGMLLGGVTGIISGALAMWIGIGW